MKLLFGAAFGGVFSLILGIVLAVGLSAAGTGCGTAAGAIDIAKIPADKNIAGYNAEQLINAAYIMNAATAMGLSVRAQQVAVMTAMGESSLRNIDHGDDAINPDGTMNTSKCLFQQQDGWGSLADRCDPQRSATLFLERLVTVPGWETMDPSTAAHTVQVNADPNHYTKWWKDAVDVVDTLNGAAAPGSSGKGCTAGEAAYPLDQPYAMTDDFGPRADTGTGASTWHPAVDLNGHCGDPIYAVLPGTVTVSDRLYLSIQSPDGFTISYLHSHKSERLVNVGDTITLGQHIAVVGNEAPSTGCHLDLRINVTGNTNPKVAALPTDPNAPGWVDPEKFMALFGVELCPADWCSRNY
ncbi:M23 family metallopeptidase [Plantibacter sp. CFBP 8775]|uniref:M23 family metallopeptidase n=1 Tax=Plantibacter sp. CFBP 8775 TaxID=2774038 RepID=UPI001781DBC0|nr:M23 family metallopeptidase [Plantibacter sp. CFBP 8775]MBD8104749.1 M23 family metallopeptidase [Plantibacter sp. CFBP 8775]